jgi:oligopeptide/dipeptide ABC transporter ATP-binding protein
MSEPLLLEVEDLAVEFPRRHDEPIRPVRSISLALRRGERLGLVGESGSGKSLTALALMRLIRPPGVIRGRIRLDGEDLVSLSAREMAKVRAGRMSMIYQDPMSSLNPVFTVGRQIAEAVRIAGKGDKAQARRRAIDLLGEVGVPDPARRADSYPHEFSGGMRQRVMIAMALASDPELLIADEPTTALDVTTQARVIDLMSRIVADRGLAVILITHDLGIAARFCDRVDVMYAGRIVEDAPVDALYDRPLHPYAEALLRSVCLLDMDVTRRMTAIDGQPPLPHRLPGGCAFHPRCPYAQDVCREAAPPIERIDGRVAECHLARDRAAAPLEEAAG